MSLIKWRPPLKWLVYTVLYRRCFKNTFIPLLLWLQMSHNQHLFWLFKGQTPSSILPKIIIVPKFMSKLLAIIACNNICKNCVHFDWLLFPQSHPCTTGYDSQSQKEFWMYLQTQSWWVWSRSNYSLVWYHSTVNEIPLIDHCWPVTKFIILIESKKRN